MDKLVVAFSTDHSAAYLLTYSPEDSSRREMCSITGRWFKGRPEISTFDPARWRLKTAFFGVGGTFYDAEPVAGYF